MPSSSDWGATLADVGALLHARTKDPQGNELGTFTSTTRPTDAQVGILIGHAKGAIENEIGVEIDERWHPAARELVALAAALRIELAYYPEQVATGRSPYAQLRELLEGGPGVSGALARLTVAMAETQEGGEEGAGDDMMPNYAYPVDLGGMVGWGTRW